MKILLDTCVWGKAKEKLLQEGHDVIWAGDWIEDPGDLEILSRAHREKRVLVTLDKDFGELAIVRKIMHSGIIRLVGISAIKSTLPHGLSPMALQVRIETFVLVFGQRLVRECSSAAVCCARALRRMHIRLRSGDARIPSTSEHPLQAFVHTSRAGCYSAFIPVRKR